MKKFIWGIVLALLGFSSMFGNTSQDGDVTRGGMFLFLGGAALVYFGRQDLEKSKAITNIALQMLRATGKIDAEDLGRKIGITEIEVREYIVEAQKKGTIPFKAEFT